MCSCRSRRFSEAHGIQLAGIVGDNLAAQQIALTVGNKKYAFGTPPGEAGGGIDPLYAAVRNPPCADHTAMLGGKDAARRHQAIGECTRTLDVFAAEMSRADVKLYINGAVRHGCETRPFDGLQEVGYLLRNFEELGRNLPARMLERAQNADLRLGERLIISSTRLVSATWPLLSRAQFCCTRQSPRSWTRFDHSKR
jgi:hypothetical protein